MKKEEEFADWMPVWDDEGLMAAIRLQGLNSRGIPRLGRLNELFASAFQTGDQPFVYPVRVMSDQVEFEGLVLADPEWDDFFEGPESQLAFYVAQGSEGWAVSWGGDDVVEFPFERINDCLYRLYQEELDVATDFDKTPRTHPTQVHVVRRAEHDARYPVGILITTTHGDAMDPATTMAMYHQVLETGARR